MVVVVGGGGGRMPSLLVDAVKILLLPAAEAELVAAGEAGYKVWLDWRPR